MPIKSYLETAALRGQCAYENGIRDDDCPYSQNVSAALLELVRELEEMTP